MLWLQGSGETEGFFFIFSQRPRTWGEFFYFFMTFMLLWEQRKENVSAWINKNKFVSLPKLCFTQTWARQRAKFCPFQKRRRWAENPGAVHQSFSLFLVFVTVINDKNNKEYGVNVVKSCEICAARLILPCAVLLRKSVWVKRWVVQEEKRL